MGREGRIAPGRLWRGRAVARVTRRPRKQSHIQVWAAQPLADRAAPVTLAVSVAGASKGEAGARSSAATSAGDVLQASTQPGKRRGNGQKGAQSQHRHGSSPLSYMDLIWLRRLENHDAGRRSPLPLRARVGVRVDINRSGARRAERAWKASVHAP